MFQLKRHSGNQPLIATEDAHMWADKIEEVTEKGMEMYKRKPIATALTQLIRKTSIPNQ